MKDEPTSIPYIITIAVDPDDVIPQGGSTGNFVYTPSLLRVSPGDTIEWRADHAFVVSFKEGTPINDMEVFGSQVDGVYTTGQQTVPSGKQGHYHYAAALAKDDRVFIDSQCPHISVN